MGPRFHFKHLAQGRTNPLTRVRKIQILVKMIDHHVYHSLKDARMALAMSFLFEIMAFFEKKRGCGSLH